MCILLSSVLGALFMLKQNSTYFESFVRKRPRGSCIFQTHPNIAQENIDFYSNFCNSIFVFTYDARLHWKHIICAPCRIRYDPQHQNGNSLLVYCKQFVVYVGVQNLFRLRKRVSYANDARVMPKMSHKTIWDYFEVVAFFIAIVYHEHYIKKSDKYIRFPWPFLFWCALSSFQFVDWEWLPIAILINIKNKSSPFTSSANLRCSESELCLPPCSRQTKRFRRGHFYSFLEVEIFSPFFSPIDLNAVISRQHTSPFFSPFSHLSCPLPPFFFPLPH